LKKIHRLPKEPYRARKECKSIDYHRALLQSLSIDYRAPHTFCKSRALLVIYGFAFFREVFYRAPHTFCKIHRLPKEPYRMYVEPDKILPGLSLAAQLLVVSQ